MKVMFLLLLAGMALSASAQTENEIVNISARICQTDSISKVLGVYSQDSIFTYHLQTPDYDTYGANTYEYEKFDLVYDVSSNLLFNQTPFGKIDIVSYGKKKCRVVIELALSLIHI